MCHTKQRNNALQEKPKQFLYIAESFCRTNAKDHLDAWNPAMESIKQGDSTVQLWISRKDFMKSLLEPF